MKLKYYLRGLGIGIVVTAVLMGIAGGGRESLSDVQIRERAAQLGMVERGSLTLDGMQAQKDAEKGMDGDAHLSGDDNAQESTAGDVKEADNAQESTAGDVKEADNAQESAAGDAKEADNAQESAAGDMKEADNAQENIAGDAQPQADSETVPEKTNADTEVQTISFTVKSGDNSDSVSRRLAEAGLVADARSFDRYLCNNGYSRVIRAGNYEIAFGTDEQEIAEIIAGKK